MSSHKLHVTRRELVASLGALGAVAAVPPAWGKTLLPSKRRIGPGAFHDGVASGEPGPNAITFWSRLETSRPRSGARLVVATDPGMRKVVAHATIPTGRGVNGTLKARIGGLKPYTEYYYVWESGTGVSPIGRTRTAPPPGAAQPLNFGVSSCQAYGSGYFNVHADAAAQALDLYLFLGDYIYETKSRASAVRGDDIQAVDLASYRAKYALYRSDPGLRELHRLHATAHVWDDHEVENNYSDNNPAPSPAQRTAGYRASFEWQPRMSFPSDRQRVYRTLTYGGFADVFMLDERQYRTGSNDGQPRHMLGEAQMTWLINSLKASKAKWKFLANQVVMAQINYDGSTNTDAWDGYKDDRARLLGEIERAGIDNVVALTGDAHVFMCSLLTSDYSTFGDGTARKPAGVEYVTGSVTSGGKLTDEAVIQKASPWNREYNAADHGYARLGIGPDQLVTDYMASDITVPNAGTARIERFTQAAGTNTVQREPPAAARV
ncbi:MAG: alkaline phosphatase [Solirubrobacteraceae bacterium]|jgi:phosphodiesterase/alkaline phosphatase D-like protein|nr:alkaline phosphatase [Solirubrobacteraceae bacterium]